VQAATTMAKAGSDAAQERLEKEWEAVQRKAFTHWVNSYLTRRGITIENLEDGLKNGVNLVHLLELLARQDMDFKFYKTPKLKIHMIENGNLCLKWLKTHDVPNVTISAENIVDGDTKMILGFCWVLLRHFRFGLDKDTSFEDALLKWVKEQLVDYTDIEITNFKTSFCDGRALLALNHKWDNEIVNYKTFDKTDPVRTITTAVKLAEEHMKVPSIIEPKALAQGDVKEKQVILYISLIFNAFQAELEKRRLAGESQAKALSLREQLKLAQDENANMKNTLKLLQEKVDVLTKLLAQETAEKEALAALRDELLRAKEQLEKETADLRAEKADLLNQINTAKKERERLEAEFNEAQQKAAASMDPLLDTLAKHLKEMHEWKVFLAQGREYESENIQLVVEKEISEFSYDDQLVTLAEALSEENEKLKGFDRERQVYLKAVQKKKK
jgi:hypothetical protein